MKSTQATLLVGSLSFVTQGIYCNSYKKTLLTVVILSQAWVEQACKLTQKNLRFKPSSGNLLF